jgi:hypothetical protein
MSNNLRGDPFFYYGVWGLRLIILWGEGEGEPPKIPSNFTFFLELIKILNEWVGFFETFGLQLFSSHLKVGLKKKNPNGPNNIIHNNLCKISTIFFIQGHLLGPQTTLV